MKRCKRIFVWVFLLSLGLFEVYAQPVLTKNIPSVSKNFTTKDGRLFFTSNDTLWTSNGTAASTYWIKKLGEPIVKFTNLSLGTFVYFTTRQSDGQIALWRTNGTASNTTKLLSYPTINPLIVYNNGLYLGINDGVHGYELWRINVANTLTMVKDVNPGSGNGLSSLGHPVVSADTLYFTGFSETGSLNMWKTNGTTATTSIALNLPYAGEGFELAAELNGLIYLTRYFIRAGHVTYYELWRSDKTSERTFRLFQKRGDIDLVFYAFHDFVAYNNKICFYLDFDPGVPTTSFWTSDGTLAGTKQVIDYVAYESFMDPLVISNNRMIISSKSWVQLPLLMSDGTKAGTKEFYRFTDYYEYSDIEATEKLLFFTDDINRGLPTGTSDELFQCDLTKENTKSLKELFGTSFQGTRNITAAGSSIYFTTPEAGKLKLWFYNPTRPSSNVPYFTLVNADTDQDIAWLKNGDYIFKSSNPHVNVRYNPVSTPGSVVFSLNDVPYRTENSAPFALAGTTGGDYNNWSAGAGNYKITATAYSLPDGSGSYDLPTTINVTVINPSARSSAYDINNTENVEAALLEAYPNPSTDNFNFSVVNQEPGTAKAEIYRMDGTLVETVFENSVSDGQSVEFSWNASNTTPGVYLCKYISGSQQVARKIVLNK